MILPQPQSSIDRFWRKINKAGPVHASLQTPCWEWTAYRNSKGYGEVRIDYVRELSHRAAWQIVNGRELKAGEYVLHKCDNPSCCNPEHLFIGSIEDNNRDMKEKGRAVRGERVGGVKLTADVVLEIRKSYAAGNSLAKLGRAFGVHHVTVFDIIHRKTWAHI